MHLRLQRTHKSTETPLSVQSPAFIGGVFTVLFEESQGEVESHARCCISSVGPAHVSPEV